MAQRRRHPRPRKSSFDSETMTSGRPRVAGLVVVIEYQDAAGRRQFRPVTLRSIKSGRHEVPRLVAYCHDRGDLRSFRVDRILSIADADGVLQEPLERFYRDVLGLSWSHRPHAISGDERIKERWAVIRRIASDHGIVLAAAVARADLQISDEEVAAMLQYLLASCHAEGVELAGDEIERARKWIARLRPSPRAIRTCLHKLEGAGLATQNEVIKACLAVADSAGFRHRRAVMLLEAFSRALLGEGRFPDGKRR